MGWVNGLVWVGGLGGWTGRVVGPKYFFCVSPWHFDNGASRMIYDVLAKDGGLLHVLPLAVHLIFFMDK